MPEYNASPPLKGTSKSEATSASDIKVVVGLTHWTAIYFVSAEPKGLDWHGSLRVAHASNMLTCGNLCNNSILSPSRSRFMEHAWVIRGLGCDKMEGKAKSI
jgi:hypothetical protein